LTIKGHWEALEYLLELKKSGYVRAVGISTHHIAGVLAASQIKEIDIIHPLINYTGIGIVDGTRTEMEDAIKSALSNDKGIYAMKALGGGNLLNNINTALDYARGLPIHSLAIGMKSLAEIDYNIAYIENSFVTEDIRMAVNLRKRKLLIEDWCQSCGNCIDKCSQKALTITDDTLLVDNEKCLLCGYCAYACKDFCIKVV
jgi:predicted aldo/keto reductase-like oxidoreductase